MATEPVFLDTGGLLIFLNQRENSHDHAVDVFQSINERRRLIMTTDLVLAELGNCIARGPLRQSGSEFIRDIIDDPMTAVVFVDKPLFMSGLKRMSNFADKSWGLVDCISFEVMASAGIRDAFTADRHFEQAGFNCLLRVPQ
ncbi:MAG: type II toxin-antitoxin system VapC family toxin [Planctomycetes bacterium]|nr:type II toxin-antitoxin system VapC family toxin [Planctomycetota bacterium]